MTIFSSKSFSDAQVRAQMESNFLFITGETRPMNKGTSKNADGITAEMWFTELSWVHCFIFCQAFHEANARGIMNAAEQEIGQQLIDMMPVK